MFVGLNINFLREFQAVSPYERKAFKFCQPGSACGLEVKTGPGVADGPMNWPVEREFVASSVDT